MGFFKGVLNFFGDILKDVIRKVLIFVITVFLILLALKHFLGIDIFKLMTQF